MFILIQLSRRCIWTLYWLIHAHCDLISNSFFCQLAGIGRKCLILFLCCNDFSVNFLTMRSSLVYTCSTNILVSNSGMPAEMIKFYCFCFLGQKRTPVKIFYSETSFSFFLLFLTPQPFCACMFIFLIFFRHHLNLFLLYLWYCQQFPDRSSVLSFLSNDPIIRLQNLHYKEICVYRQISNTCYLLGIKFLLGPWPRL